MLIKKFFILIVLIITMGCFSDKTNVIKTNISSNPSELDTEIIADSSSKFILSHIFEGLTTEDSNGKIIPAVAESWSVNDKIWTFIINPKAKWENGDSVKAQDFVTAWERIINPINSNENAYKMFLIKNAADYNQGKVGFDSVGIKVLNESTLQVELNENNFYFDILLAQEIFYPINTKFYEKNKEKYGIGKKYILGNGPYKIEKWENFKEIILKKSKKYRDANKVKIGKINIMINGDISQLKELYKINKIDILNLPMEEMLEYKKNKEKMTFQTGEISFIQFNTAEKIFSNKKIRRAISMAINRKEFIGLFKFNTAEPAESFIPGNISGKNNFFRKEYDQTSYGVTYDFDKANSLFQEGLNELGLANSNIKNINLLVRANDIEVAIGNFIKQQLKKTLNLDVNLETETSQMRDQKISNNEYQFTFDTFSSKVPDATSYLEKWVSTNYQNLTGWKNLEYDKVIKSISDEKEIDNRVILLNKAEGILMQGSPMAPIAFSMKNILVKEKLKGVTLSNISGEINLKYAEIK